MKTKLFILILLVLATVLTANAQTAKPKQTAAKSTAAQATQKQAEPMDDAKIMYDNERQFFYIAGKESGKFIKLLPYKEVNQFSEGLALVKTGKSIGFINQKGTEIVPPNGKYQWAEDFSNGMAAVGTNNEKGEKKAAGYINKSGVLVIPMVYQEAKNFSENLAAVKKNDKWGFVNKTGAVVIPIKYAEAYSFTQGLAIVKQTVANQNALYGYIDKTGKTIIPFKFVSATGFRKSYPDEYALVQNEQYAYQLIDKKGETVDELKYFFEKKVYNTALKYDEDKSENISPVSARWLQDGSDNIVVEYKIDYYQTLKGVYSLGAAAFKVKPEYADLMQANHGDYLVLSTFNKKGICRYHEIVPAYYDFIFDQDSLYYAVYGGTQTENGISGGKYTLYNYDGKQLTKYDDKAGYDELTPFSEGLARVKRNGKFGFINKKGEEIIPIEYDSAGVFISGIAVVFKGGKAGGINKKNETVIPLEYDLLGYFAEGFSSYKTNNLAGIMDANGKKITEPVFEGLGTFSEGLAPFMKDKKIGYVNTKGEIMIPAEYDSGNPFSDGYALISKIELKVNDPLSSGPAISTNPKVGFIDSNGKVVIPLKYNNAADFLNGYAIVQDGDAIHLIDKKGEIVKSYSED